MTRTAVAAAEAPEPSVPQQRPVKPLSILAVGGLTILSWLGFLAAGFLAVDEVTTRLLSDLLLVMVVLSAAAAVWSGVRVSAVISVVAGVIYIGVWYTLGKILWAVPDVIDFALIAGFYLSVPLSAVSTLVAGRKVLRSAS